MNKKTLKVLSAVLVLILSLTMALPALADPIPVSTSGKVQFDKALTVNEYAVIPAELNFTFTLAGVSEPSATVENFTPKTGIVEGVEMTLPEGATYTDDVSYSAGTVTVKYKTGDNTTTNKLTTKGFVLDFSKVAWTEAGVYRYTLKETNGGSTIDGVTYDGQTYYIDVYVIQSDSGYAIANTVVSKGGVIADTASGNENTYEDKVDATPESSTATSSDAKFENTVAAYDLTISKTVSGNQGEKNKDFNFTISFENLVPNGIYTYTDSTGNHTFQAGQDGKYTFSSTGTPITLTNNQNIKFEDLPYGAKYTITEDDYSGYTTTSTARETANGTEEGDVLANGRVVSDTITGIKGDTTVGYTNTKDGTIPTGILLTIAPFAALVIIGFAGIVVVLLKKKKAAK